MADLVVTATQRLTREQVSAFVGGNPRAIRLIELLTQDVGSTLPAAATANAAAAESAGIAASAAQSTASAALTNAATAQGAADAAQVTANAALLAATPGGVDTSVQIGSAGAFAGFSTFTYVSGSNTLSVGHITGSALAMTIQPMTPTAADDGGALTLQARTATGTAKNGGGVVIQAGGSSSGTAGGITLTPGAAAGGNGAISLKSVAGGDALVILDNGAASKIGLFGATPVVRQTVTGSRAGNAALASLLTALATLGVVVDSSTV